MATQLVVALLSLVWIVAFPRHVTAQATNQGLIVRDSSLGDLRDMPVPPGTDARGFADYLIETRFGERIDDRVFHSFSRFGVGTGETAAFEFDETISLYLVRVTGSEDSFVDGILRLGTTLAGTADLFLMNPNGVVFGENSALDMPGTSLHVGAAEALEFEDGGVFSSDLGIPVPRLSVAPVSDFGFVSTASGEIEIAGATLSPGYGFHLTGRTISIRDDARVQFRPFLPRSATLSLRASDSISVSGSSDLGQVGPLENRSPQPLESIVLEADTIEISEGTTIEASGFNPTTSGGPVAPGRIDIRARDSFRLIGPSGQGSTVVRSLALDRESISEDGLAAISIEAPRVEITGQSLVSTTTGTPSSGGGVDVRAEDFVLSGPARIQSNSITFATGAAGAVSIAAERAVISDGAALSSFSATGADAGSVRIEAGDLIVDGGSISSEALSGGGGDIVLQIGRRANITDGLVSASVADGDGGNVAIESGESLVLRDQTAILARAASIGGTGGRIGLAAPAVAIETGVALDATAPGGPAAQGTVELIATELATDPTATTLEASLLQSPRPLIRQCRSETEASELVVTNAGHPAPDDLQDTAALEVSKRPREAIRLALHARQAVETAGAPEVARIARTAREALDHHATPERIRILLHLATTVRDASRATTDQGDRAASRQLAWQLLSDALNEARAVEDLRSVAYAWGALAELYEADGQYAASRNLTERALAVIATIRPDSSHHRWHWLDARLEWRAGNAARAMAAYERATTLVDASERFQLATRGRIDAIRTRHARPDAEAVRLERLELIFRNASGNAGSSSKARAIVDSLRLRDLRNYFRDPCLADTATREIQDSVARQTAAVVHLIPMEDRLEILVSVRDRIERFSVDASLQEVERTSLRFRIALEKPFTNQHRAQGKQLYDWLVRPYEDLLVVEGIETVIFAPTGPVAGIPFAALRRDEGYLVDDYAISYAGTNRVVAAMPGRSFSKGIVAGGVSRFGPDENRSALPSVERELAAIREYVPGTFLLNEEFDIAGLGAALADVEPPVLHIASHGVLGENASASYIETWGERLTLDELGNLILRRRRSQSPIDLLVLSACETTTLDARADLALAGVAARAGVRNVLGALWAISDDATLVLMDAFYDGLSGSDVTAAEALRRAQTTLRESEQFAHPYYWAGLVLTNSEQ